MSGNHLENSVTLGENSDDPMTPPSQQQIPAQVSIVN